MHEQGRARQREAMPGKGETFPPSSIRRQAERKQGHKTYPGSGQPHQYQSRRLFVPKWTSQLVDWAFSLIIRRWDPNLKTQPSIQELWHPRA